MKIKFTIPGNPFGKQRPFVAHHRGFKRKESVLHENIAREAWHQAYSDKLFDGNVSIDLTAYYCIPASWPKWKQEAAKLGCIRPHHKGPKKPDVDNVCKLIMDSLNPVKVSRKTVPNTGVYEDDGQVVDLNISSYYSENPRVEAVVDAYPEMDPAELKAMVKKWKVQSMKNSNETKYLGKASAELDADGNWETCSGELFLVNGLKFIMIPTTAGEDGQIIKAYSLDSLKVFDMQFVLKDDLKADNSMTIAIAPILSRISKTLNQVGTDGGKKILKGEYLSAIAECGPRNEKEKQLLNEFTQEVSNESVDC